MPVSIILELQGAFLLWHKQNLLGSSPISIAFLERASPRLWCFDFIRYRMQIGDAKEETLMELMLFYVNCKKGKWIFPDAETNRLLWEDLN